MQLKDYQSGVLESLSRYLQRLSAGRQDAEEVLEFQRGKGREAKACRLLP
jgi:type III restriction enzyme